MIKVTRKVNNDPLETNMGTIFSGDNMKFISLLYFPMGSISSKFALTMPQDTIVS